MINSEQIKKLNILVFVLIASAEINLDASQKSSDSLNDAHQYSPQYLEAMRIEREKRKADSIWGLLSSNKQGEVQELIQEMPAVLTLRHQGIGDTPLHWAAIETYLENNWKLDLLLKQPNVESFINIRNDKGVTPLFRAADELVYYQRRGSEPGYIKKDVYNYAYIDSISTNITKLLNAGADPVSGDIKKQQALVPFLAKLRVDIQTCTKPYVPVASLTDLIAAYLVGPTPQQAREDEQWNKDRADGAQSKLKLARIKK